MYISRFELNKKLRETHRLLQSAERIHAAVLGCFPSNTQQILWRIDDIDSSKFLIVVSPIRPDFKHMQEKYGWNNGQSAGRTVNYMPFLSKLKTGDKFRFKLDANPVFKFSGKNVSESVKHPRKKGKVYGMQSIEEHNNWLISKASKNGFLVEKRAVSNTGEVEDRVTFIVRKKGKLRFYKSNNEKRQLVTIAIATYEGILEITDVDMFRKALTTGIGRAKAYGQGMLTIAKI
ncbi:MAG: type I-E CRISPR-associated protein Cas6/Cse3/CasE [Candidatus Ancillula sp.]|jgi:CRISPR system Cascade subunit CasE|nr:type I-E CRISPR-associated protein Cas6/Cse3/CasE [Candidatus Ancillula sp.]